MQKHFLGVKFASLTLKNNSMLKDESIMPIGEYKGRKMEDVPARYLVYLFDEQKVQKKSDVGNYIIRNLETLRLQAKNESKGIF